VGIWTAAHLRSLCEHLAEYTAMASDCYFCLWAGYGNLERYGWLEEAQFDIARQARGETSHVLSRDELGRGRLHLSDRVYLLLKGPLTSVLRLGKWIDSNSFWPQSPNLFWPADQAWVVASEIDFDSTIVGGAVELIEKVLKDSALDAWAIRPEDSLAFDAPR
jgi:hypothetical protein